MNITKKNAILSVKHLDLYYTKFHALKDISMDMQRNKITAFIGLPAAANRPCSKRSTG